MALCLCHAGAQRRILGGEGFKGRAKDSHYLSKDFEGLFLWSSRTGLLEFKRKTAEQASGNLSSCPKESGRGKEKAAASELRAWRSTTWQ